MWNWGVLEKRDEQAYRNKKFAMRKSIWISVKKSLTIKSNGCKTHFYVELKSLEHSETTEGLQFYPLIRIPLNLKSFLMFILPEYISNDHVVNHG